VAAMAAVDAAAAALPEAKYAVADDAGENRWFQRGNDPVASNPGCKVWTYF